MCITTYASRQRQLWKFLPPLTTLLVDPSTIRRGTTRRRITKIMMMVIVLVTSFVKNKHQCQQEEHQPRPRLLVLPVCESFQVPYTITNVLTPTIVLRRSTAGDTSSAGSKSTHRAISSITNKNMIPTAAATTRTDATITATTTSRNMITSSFSSLPCHLASFRDCNKCNSHHCYHSHYNRWKNRKRGLCRNYSLARNKFVLLFARMTEQLEDKDDERKEDKNLQGLETTNDQQQAEGIVSTGLMYHSKIHDNNDNGGDSTSSRNMDIPTESLSSSWSFTNSSTVDKVGSISSFLFKSDPMQVYIEDTDAYAVMYNANYIRAYERALFQFYNDMYKQGLLQHQSQQEMQEAMNNETSKKSFHLWNPSNHQHMDIYDDFRIKKVTAHKFKSSPILGSSYVIHGNLVHIQSMDGIEEDMWSLEMLACDEKIKSPEANCFNDHIVESKSSLIKSVLEKQETGMMDKNDKKPTVYNTAIVTISRKGPNKNDKHTNQYSVNSSMTNFQRHDIFTVHRDEFDIHMPNALPVRTILNLFERQRSNWLGGPHVLKKMQKEYSLLWVVTSIDNLEIFDAGLSSHGRSTADMEFTNKGCNSPALPFIMVQPGMKVLVKSNIQVKRRGMILEFHQEVAFLKNDTEEKVGDDNCRNYITLAHGLVTICAIDSEKGRPTSNIPPEIKRMLSIEV